MSLRVQGQSENGSTQIAAGAASAIAAMSATPNATTFDSSGEWLSEQIRNLGQKRDEALSLSPQRASAADTPLAARGLTGPAKRVLDLMIAIPALIFLAPMLAIIALAIKLESPGPVFFRQQRHGLNSDVFRIFKFRSMRDEAFDAAKQATKVDDRVTKVGRILRATSLDELPQLLNVVKGEMSLVGPRPHSITHDRVFSDVHEPYTLRFRSKPGITGLAQIRGSRGEIRSLADVVVRTDFDLEYQRRWNVFLDIKIIASTPIIAVHQFISGQSY